MNKIMKLFLGVVFLILFYSCKNCFSRIEYENELKWEKTYCSKQNRGIQLILDSTEFIKQTISPIVIGDDYVYEFDSVRVYVEQKDTLLNHLLSEGIIRGEYFFEEDKRFETVHFFQSHLLKKNKYNWFGYHITLVGINPKNIISDKIPKKSRQYFKQKRVFNLRVYLPTKTYYANPNLFRLEIEHDYLTL